MGKNWKTDLIALLIIVLQAFLDMNKGKVDEQSFVGYAAAAGFKLASDAKKENK